MDSAPEILWCVFLEDRMKTLTVHKDRKPCYDIIYSTDLDDLVKGINDCGLTGRRFVIVTDTNVALLYARQIADVIAKAAGQMPLVYAIPAGEENKNLDQIRALYKFLIEQKCDRKSVLAALGGGVVGDMTGFAAATFLRGIDFIQIPTTLLAQADSSIGGKTGVDFEGYKNMVGAFKMPRLVFSDVEFLKSLPGIQFASGFAEIMKHGLIRDKDYYLWLVEHQYEIQEQDPETLTQMLYRSNEIKRDIVEKDPYEKHDRMLLNFGHTIGHAVEKYKNFTMTHGECVALGCVAASYLSWQRGYLDKETFYEIRDMFVPFNLPISVEDIDEDEIVRITKSDKKVANGLLRFVLLRDLGDAYVDTTVTDEELKDAVHAIHYEETND